MHHVNAPPIDIQTETFRLSSAYLAPISYYIFLAQARAIWLDLDDVYERQSYRNRCVIATSQGPMSLTIPVEKPNSSKQTMREIRIANHGHWQSMHWKALESAYSSSPYFEFYKDDIAPFYHQKWDFLFDFNRQLQHAMVALLDINPTYIHGSGNEHNVWDMREKLHPKKPELLSYDPYYQVFTPRFGFVPKLSIIDLLLNKGNESILTLNKKKYLSL